MADYSAVLRNALTKVDATSEAVRQTIYQKARDSISRKIEALPQQPSQAAIDAQFAKLDAAIAEVEADFDMPVVADEPMVEEPEVEAAPEPVVEEPVAVEPEPDPVVDPEPEPEPELVAEDEPESVIEDKADPVLDEPAVLVEDATTKEAEARDPLLDFLEDSNAAEFTEPLDRPIEPELPSVGSDADDAIERALSAVPEVADKPDELIQSSANGLSDLPEKTGPRWGLLGGLVAVAAIVGGLGYAAYTNQDALREMTGQTATDDAGVPVRTVPSTVVTPSDVATAPEDPAVEPAEPAVQAGSDAEDPDKFTQRLTEDGTEVDDGPLGGEPQAGEGSSVSTQSEGIDTTIAPTPEGEDAAAVTPLPVGQRALFYEERTGSQAGTSFPGAAIWSVVQEEPADGLEPEPAIRVEASVPDLGIVLEMVIKRNGDTTLPASHIAELFFRVPTTFAGRGIADVQRLTLKAAEGDPGNALIAVPAPIDTNIFLIALNNADTAVESNVALLREREWIDIPMQYVSGRRALITLEKGSAGRAVFDEVFAAWAANPL